MKNPAVPAVLSFLLFSLCLSAAAQDKVLLVHRAAKGNTTRNTVEATFKVDAGGKTSNMVATSTETDTITAAAATGDITWESKMGVSTTTLNGVKQPEGPADENPGTTVIHADGSMVSTNPMPSDPFTRTLACCQCSIIGITFVNHPVGTGDTWSVKVKPSVEGIVPAVVDYKVLASGVRQGADCFQIQCNFRETSGEKPVTAASTVWVDKKTGDTLSADLTMSNVYLGPTAATVHIRIFRIDAPANSAPKAK